MVHPTASREMGRFLLGEDFQVAGPALAPFTGTAQQLTSTETEQADQSLRGGSSGNRSLHIFIKASTE